MDLDVDPGPRQRHRRRDPADPAADHHRPQSHVLQPLTAGRAAGQASWAGPRLVIWRAMIMRWISLVPSQMRSTRSSRKKRSATFSRM